MKDSIETSAVGAEAASNETFTVDVAENQDAAQSVLSPQDKSRALTRAADAAASEAPAPRADIKHQSFEEYFRKTARVAASPAVLPHESSARRGGVPERDEICRAIVDALPDCINAKDRNGRFVVANPATALLMGAASADDLIGKTDFDFYPQEMAKTFQAQESTVLAGEIFGPIEENVVLPDGSTCWLKTLKTPLLDAAGNVAGIITRNRDISEKKRLEAELRTAHGVLTAALTHMADGLVMYDCDGRIKFCNQRYRDMFPRTSDLRAPGALLADILRAAVARGEEHPDGDVEAWIAGRLAGLGRARDYFITLEDGRSIEARQRPAAHGDTLITFSDISDLRRSEAAAREANTMLMMAEEIAHVGHWRVAVPTNKVTWSDEVFRIHGLDPAQEPPSVDEAIEFYHPDDRAEVSRCLSEAIALKRDFEFTLRLIRRDGSRRDVLARGRCELHPASNEVNSIFGVFVDITEAVEAQRALRKKTLDLQATLDNMDEGLIKISADKRIEFANRRFFDLLGLPPSADIHPDDYVDVERMMNSLMNETVRGDRVTLTYRIRHKAGHWLWVEAAINLVRSPETGAPESLLLSLRDVSERQRTARHLERARVEAEKAASLKTEFLANMSHELRTPLTGMLGIYDLLEQDPTLGAEQKRNVALAREAGRSLLGIVNDILDFSKIEAGQMVIEERPFKLADLVESCRLLAQEVARRKSLPVAADLNGVPETLVGDAARLRQVILNLLTNAVKFTERGGVLIAANYDQAAERLRVEIIDSGIGITQEKLPLLFERFSQTDASITRRFGGTGLGLAISKRLVELMRGQIGVTSELGRGSTFWFELPLRVGGDDSGDPPVERRSTWAAGRNVLLAEDNAVNQMIIQKMLEARGHRVTIVEDGSQALEALGDKPKFDVVLMDLQMPVMDGFTATATIRDAEQRDRRRPVPIIGLTANAMMEDVGRCLAVGMQAHVAKPIEWELLFAAMDRVTQEAAKPTPAAREPRPVVVDEATLAHLSGVLGPARMAALLEMFIKDLEGFLAELESIDDGEAAARCHKMKSSAGQLGFCELSQICEIMTKDRRPGSARLRRQELSASLQRAVEAARSSPMLGRSPSVARASGSGGG